MPPIARANLTAMDLLLAILHHLAAFGIVAGQSIAVTMLRGTLDPPRLARLATIDRLHWIAIGLVVAAGTGRIFTGAKGAAFYVANPSFWAKMVLVAAIVALSVAPARRYVEWRNAAAADPAFRPPDQVVVATRRLVFWASHLVLFVLVAAVLMARGIGL
jgi:putative membrane protein